MKLNKLIAFLKSYEVMYPDENIEEKEVYFFDRHGKVRDTVDLYGDGDGQFLILEGEMDYSDGLVVIDGGKSGKT